MLTNLMHSAVVHGVVLPVSDAEEKQEAFRMLVEELVPGRWDASRQPDEEETRGTGILRVKVESARQVHLKSAESPSRATYGFIS